MKYFVIVSFLGTFPFETGEAAHFNRLKPFYIQPIVYGCKNIYIFKFVIGFGGPFFYLEMASNGARNLKHFNISS